MTKEESETRADAVLAEMRVGSICAVTPERARRIVAEALQRAAADEREACANLADKWSRNPAKCPDPITLFAFAETLRLRTT